MSERNVWALGLLSVLLLTYQSSAQNMIINNEFDHGLASWRADPSAGALEDAPAMDVMVDSTSQLAGKHSAKIEITQAGTWFTQLQLWQFCKVKQFRVYDISFRAKASSTLPIRCTLMRFPYGEFAVKESELKPEPQTFTLHGITPENDEAGLSFMFGKVPTGATVWIDSVTMTESEIEMPKRLENKEEGTVLVDFTKDLAPATARSSGLLFGFVGSEPEEEWIQPLRFQAYRAGEPFWSLFQDGLYERLQRLGVPHIYVIVPGSHVPKPGSDDAAWEQRVSAIQTAVRRVQDAGLKNIEYEIAYEPDGAKLWRSTRAHFYENWKRSFHAIRAVDPDAVVIGPSTVNFWSFNYIWMTDFLTYCKANDCTPDILNWHHLSATDGDGIPVYVELMRQWLAKNDIDIDRFALGEIIPQNRQLVPGTAVSYMANIERTTVESAARTCWNEAPASGEGKDVSTC